MGGSVFSEHVPLTGGKSGKMIKKWISGYTNSILESKEEHRMEFTPYIRFNGSCREAVEFYAKAFGAEQPKFLTFGESGENPAWPMPEEAKKLMREYAPEASFASWAFRFAASQEGVVRVLSGMNTMEQVMDNTATFRDFRPITEEEMAVIRQVTEIIEKNTPIPCTACSYCTHGCPKGIAIPEYFALYNSISRTTGSFSSQAVYYNNISLKHGKASDCIGCRQCERACPQHLPITDYLKDVAAKFEAGSSFPTRK